MARQPPTPVPETKPIRSECLLDLNARQRSVDANAKSAGNAEWLQLSATSPHHRKVVSGGSHHAFLRPANGCADAWHHWLGHILRMPADRLVHRAVSALGQRDGPPYQPGSILMDTPLPLTELLQRAADRRGWARDGRSLSSPQESP